MNEVMTFITPIYAGFFGLMLVILSRRVVKLRKKQEHHKMTEHEHQDLSAAVRAQDNLIEYLPTALILMWMVETMQFNAWVLHALGILLLASRLMHVYGASNLNQKSIGRRLGTRLTWVQLILSSLLCFMGAVGVVF